MARPFFLSCVSFRSDQGRGLWMSPLLLNVLWVFWQIWTGIVAGHQLSAMCEEMFSQSCPLCPACPRTVCVEILSVFVSTTVLHDTAGMTSVSPCIKEREKTTDQFDEFNMPVTWKIHVRSHELACLTNSGCANLCNSVVGSSNHHKILLWLHLRVLFLSSRNV